MEQLKGEVFRFFEEICQIPHGSGNVKQISDYCAAFAKEQGLRFRQDEHNNIIIWKKASPGREDRPTVIIQGHLDMVCVKEPGSTKDLAKEGLSLETDGDMLFAKQTSLGADDGIAVAYALAVLASKEIEHPPLEVILTVDEEIGMLGATALKLEELNGRIMLNIDSEEEGIFLAGCAGGATVVCTIPLSQSKADGVLAEISIDGLTGGHSGTEIVCQRANANELLGRLFLELSDKLLYRVISVNGGEKDNAIAKMASVRLLVRQEDTDVLVTAVKAFETVICHEYEATDPDLKVSVSIKTFASNQTVYEKDTQQKLIMALNYLPSGIQKMSADIKGLVQTSLNLGILREEEHLNTFTVNMYYSVRSAVKSEKENLIKKLQSFTEYLGGSCCVSGEYPAWEYRKESPLREKMIEIYKKMFHAEPKVETIHAGVECGIIADKLQGLDCISFGPDILDIHTTRERLSISSTERTYAFLLAVLREL